MNEATLVNVASLVELNMRLMSTSRCQHAEGVNFQATVSGEATVVSPFGSQSIHKATGTASGETPSGAQILAYAACLRAFIVENPSPEAFVRDIEKLGPQCSVIGTSFMTAAQGWLAKVVRPTTCLGWVVQRRQHDKR